MENVILVIHLFLALSIIGLVLMQRSEGGGLGIGGGGLGGIASPKGTANALTKATAYCAAAFFCTSLILGILAGQTSNARKGLLEGIENTAAPAAAEAPADATAETTPAAPAPEAPAAAPEAPLAQ